MQYRSNINYDNKYLCYIDILGFSNIICNPDNKYYLRNLNFFRKAINILKKIPKKQDMLLQKQTVTQFSDCVVISCNNDILSLSMMIDRIREVQNKLLEGGLLTRGAITKGNIYHNQRYIIGPALVYAVQLEKIAQTPRVIIHDDILQDIIDSEVINFKIDKDDDGKYYVKYIDYWCNDDSPGFLHLRKTILAEFENQKEIRDKYVWLAKKFNNRLQSKNIPGIEPILY